MPRSAADKANAAADHLLDWVRGQHVARAASAQHGPTAEESAAAPQPAAVPQRPPPPAASSLPHPDWLYHRLVVAGPADEVAAFRTAAEGAGTVPWQLDLDRMEEDLVHVLLAPPSPQRRVLSAAGARILAGQLRQAAEQRSAIAVAQVGRSRACPFDLHVLVPVPGEILRLGPDHPDARHWLWTHWGTTETLRRAEEDRFAVLGRHPVLRTDPGRLHLSFWSADWTPWRALATVAAAWPALRFEVTPVYDPP